MEIKQSRVEENIIKNLKFDFSFIDLSYDRFFERFEVNGFKYLLGWRSDLLAPKVLNIEERSLIVLGIDQKLIIVDYFSNVIKANRQLDYLFHESYVKWDRLIVATELELLIFNLSPWGLFIEPLPGNFESLSFEEEQIVVKCIDYHIIKIDK